MHSFASGAHGVPAFGAIAGHPCSGALQCHSGGGGEHGPPGQTVHSQSVLP